MGGGREVWEAPRAAGRQEWACTSPLLPQVSTITPHVTTPLKRTQRFHRSLELGVHLGVPHDAGLGRAAPPAPPAPSMALPLQLCREGSVEQ